MSLPPSRSERIIELYRGFTLVHERMGHTNVQTDDAWYGGHRTAADARRAVDAIVDKPITRRLSPEECVARGLSADTCAYITEKRVR